MARKRNIAPGFFKNEDLGECAPLARLLFAGLWCWADRLGRVEDRPKRLRAEILPYDQADGEVLVAELAQHGFVKRYEAAGVRVLQIVNFDRFQDPHPREAASLLPDEAGNIEGSPEADLGRTLGEPPEPPSPASSLARSLPRPSHSPDPLASLAGERAGKGNGVPDLGPLGRDVVAQVSAGLGKALRPLRDAADAAEFEERLGRFGGGVEEAIDFFSRTCRRRDRTPDAVALLLLWLRDLDPKAKAARRAAGGA